MQLQTDEFIRACARIDPGTRTAMADALDKLRIKLMEEMVSVDAENVNEYRGAVRTLKQVIHTVAHASQLVRQIDEGVARSASASVGGGMKLVP